MRFSMLPQSALFYVFVAITPVRSSVDLDFSAYPTSTQTCLDGAAGIAGCNADTGAVETVAEVNQCLCSNTGNFVTNTATCVGRQGTAVLAEVWALLQQSCSETKTPLDISQAEFFASGTTTDVTSTITTTSAGFLTTYTTTRSTSTKPAAASATASSNDGASDASVVASTRIGGISAIVAGIMVVICTVCLIVLLKKRKRDQALLKEALRSARQADRYRGPDKPLLNPGDDTPGSTSSLGNPGQGRAFGASVVPPKPSYPGSGTVSPQGWRPATPTELFRNQRGLEPHDDGIPGHLPHWPSPMSQSQQVGTMGSWCPSPLSAVSSSNVLGVYSNGGRGTIGGTSTSTSPLSRQTMGTTTVRSSWAHNMPPQEEPCELPGDQDELYELPGNEVRGAVEAESTPIVTSRIPERLSMSIGSPPPQYSAGKWNDPITDKPPTG